MRIGYDWGEKQTFRQFFKKEEKESHGVISKIGLFSYIDRFHLINIEYQLKF